MYIVSWVLCCDFPPLQLPPLLLSLFLHSLSSQLYPCIQVLTTEANKCLIVAGEERAHRSRSLSLLWCAGWGGGSRFEDTSWEGKIKIEKKENIGEVSTLWDGGEGEGDQGVSLEATGAVTTGNLIYLMSSWLHFRLRPGLRRTQKRTVHFPLHVHSGPSLLFIFFFI